jgi:hypothetical protein
MFNLSNDQTIEFLRRSYTAIDGLWFVKIEEKYGFEAALEIDREVWKVFPKVQARALKSLTGLSRGLDALLVCFTTRLAVENFSFRVLKSVDCVRVTIEKCPWHELMLKSARQDLSGRIGKVVCQTECETWVGEFGEDIIFETGERICTGDKNCLFCFRKRQPQING